MVMRRITSAPGNLTAGNCSTLEEAHPLSNDECERSSAIVGRLSDEERELLAASACSEDLLMRVVRGFRKRGIGEAVSCLQKVLEWRDHVGADEKLLCRRFPKHAAFHAAWPSLAGGEDVWGHPLWVEQIAALKLKNLVEPHFSISELLMLRAQILETLQREKLRVSEELGHRVYKHIYIMDLKNLEVGMFSDSQIRAILKGLISSSSEYYTETCWKMYLVNSPITFRAVWAVVKAWIDPDTVAKIAILGGPKAYLPELQSAGVPLEAVPRCLGGRHPGRPYDALIDAYIQKTVAAAATGAAPSAAADADPAPPAASFSSAPPQQHPAPPAADARHRRNPSAPALDLLPEESEGDTDSESQYEDAPETPGSPFDETDEEDGVAPRTPPGMRQRTSFQGGDMGALHAATAALAVASPAG